MTAQRRGRNGYGSRKRQRQVIPQPQPSQSTSEEESTDGGSVTRCVCGESHNMGLMVQCDQCEVWQHCECVGLEEQDIPDQYYCEECKPENHSVIRLSHGRVRRSYSSIGHHAASANAEKKAPKKRMTFNSREASMSLEDVLAARNALEFSRSLLDPIPDSPPQQHQQQQQQQQLDEQDAVDEKATSQSPSTDTKEHHASTSLETDTAADDAMEVDKVISKPKRLNSGRSSKNDDNGRQGSDSSSVASGRVTKANEKRPRANNGRRTNSSGSKRGQSGGVGGGGSKPRSRTSTPQPVDNASSSSTSDARSSIFDKLSPAARESSPPARVRYPSARMTISEMNRRTKQILEYISSIQVEMANKETMSPACHCPQTTSSSSTSSNNPIGAGTDQDNNSSNNSNGNKPASIIIPERKVHDSPSSSMSSASTIPLEESTLEEEARIHHEEKSVAEEAIEKMNASKEQSSLEIMDMLTRELIKFQRRFGSTAVATQLGRGRQRDMVANDDEREGRITRSREASANSSFFSEKRTAHA